MVDRHASIELYHIHHEPYEEFDVSKPGSWRTSSASGGALSTGDSSSVPKGDGVPTSAAGQNPGQDSLPTPPTGLDPALP
ncbi:hypothetical protein BROUX41_002654 [Berkeleyomyces rouxiae]